MANLNEPNDHVVVTGKLENIQVVVDIWAGYLNNANPIVAKIDDYLMQLNSAKKNCYISGEVHSLIPYGK